MSLLKPRENVGIFVSYRRADTAGRLFTPSLMDPEMLRLQAVWTAALGALLFGFFGRRSIRWWRHATVAMCVSLVEIIVAGSLAFVYVVQVPEARIMDLFDNKKIVASP
jgi:hypothetical protein